MDVVYFEWQTVYLASEEGIKYRKQLLPREVVELLRRRVVIVACTLHGRPVQHSVHQAERHAARASSPRV